jgi:menaquinone-9 beta-reductase
VSEGDTVLGMGSLERDERTRLGGGYDVLVCGASFAGLAAARELSGSGARVLVVDRYGIGERPTSACGIPTDWLRVLGLIEVELQRFGELVVHVPGGTTVLDLPYTFSTFNYDEMCELLWRQCDATFEIATVIGRSAGEDGQITVETDRGPVSAPLVIDALGWRRILATDDGFQPLDAPLTRALEVHPPGASDDLEVWVDRRYVRAGYGWSFPAGDELRIGVCSYDPSSQVREGTDLIAADLGRERVRYQGNWIPHELRSATEGDVFFAGDSAGQCLALTAEGIRTALYFGIAVGREMRAVFEGWQSRDEALARYARFSDEHRRGFGVLLFVQRLIPWIPPRLLAPAFRIYKNQRLVDLTFNAYLRVAPPDFADGSADDRDGPREQQRISDQPELGLGENGAGRTAAERSIP